MYGIAKDSRAAAAHADGGAGLIRDGEGIGMELERVRFSSHPRPFRVRGTQCVTLTCPCSQVTFELTEIVSKSAPAPERLRLTFEVHPEDWREVGLEDRPPEHSKLIEEFLRDYPAAERLRFQQAMLEKRRIARRLHEHRFDAELLSGGRLVSFDEIVSDPGSEGGPQFLDQFDHEGRRYLIFDRYCANPDCHCDEYHLEFLLYAPAAELAVGAVRQCSLSRSRHWPAH